MNNLSPKISIIMPVYNGAEWLEESINSVINQTFNDFELICVNDSSPDNSEEILKEFSIKDARIKYYTKENGGPASALNYGVEQAKGEYLCFIDQDDKYAKNYLEVMLETITKTGCALCECNAYFWEDESLIRVPYPNVEPKDGIVNIASAKQKKPFSGHYFPQWTKIVKRSFWLENDIKFPDRENKAHDVPVHYKLIGLCDKIGYVEECIYYHRVHSEQISYNFDMALYYFMSARDVLTWLNGTKISFARKRTIKDFIKYLFRCSASCVKEVSVFDELLKLLSEYYNPIDAFGLRRHILKRKKKFIKHPNILELPKIQNAMVGKNSYCAKQPFIANQKTRIGNFVSIGENVRIGHGIHPLSFLSSSPYFYFDNLGWKNPETKSHNEFWNYEPVIIGNDVWIGDNVLIKNGVKIGDGAVIGMGAIVTKDIPPYAVVAGTPAKVIKYRFDEETIQKLLELKWWNLDDSVLKNVPYDNIEETIQYLSEKKA